MASFHQIRVSTWQDAPWSRPCRTIPFTTVSHDPSPVPAERNDFPIGRKDQVFFITCKIVAGKLKYSIEKADEVINDYIYSESTIA